MGKTRSKQMQEKEGDYSEDGSTKMGDKFLNVQVGLLKAVFCQEILVTDVGDSNEIRDI